MRLVRWLGLALSLSFAATPGLAQQLSGQLRVQLGVEPASVSVGEPFLSSVRVFAPSGVSVEFGEVPAGDSVQALEPPRLAREDSAAVAVYRVVAWAAGEPAAPVTIRLTVPNGDTRSVTLNLRMPQVVSVLPPEPTPVEPRPAHDVLPVGAEGTLPWWWWIAILVGTLAAALLGYLMLRRRTREEEPTDPRVWALNQLGSDGVLALLQDGNIAEFYRRVAWIVRNYTSMVKPQFGLDLTTSELASGLRAAGETGELVSELAGLLGSADRVKFARYTPTLEEAEKTLLAARRWIEAFPPVADPSEPRRAA